MPICCTVLLLLLLITPNFAQERCASDVHLQALSARDASVKAKMKVNYFDPLFYFVSWWKV
jgi:hypothetical protein